MKNDEKVKKGKWSLMQYSVWSLLLIIFTVLTECAFVLVLGALDVLPGKYTVMIIALIIILDLCIFLLLREKVKTVRKRVGVAISLLLVVIMALGTYYLYSTYDMMQKVSSPTGQWEEFCVIVTENSRYKKIDDITGETVWTVKSNSKTQKEAMGMLQTKAEVDFRREEDDMAVAEKVSSDKAKKNSIAMMSRTRYDLVAEERDGFKNSTKIIYKMSVPVPSSDNASNIDVTEDSFNLYISGSDARGDITETARTDVNMIVTVNPTTKTILLTSIPRDAYMPLHMNGEMDKITHTGMYGVDETLNTVKDWIGVDMDFYTRVGFSMLVNLVNAVDGIDVYSKYAFKSAVTDWTYKKGWNHMSGKKALYFARERKAFKDKDAERVKNQQRVIKALIKKITSSRTMLMNYTELLDAVEDSMQTNLSQKDMAKLVKMQIDDMSKWKVMSQSIDGKFSEAGTWSMGPNRPLDVFIPDKKSVVKCRKKIQEVMYPVENN